MKVTEQLSITQKKDKGRDRRVLRGVDPRRRFEKENGFLGRGVQWKTEKSKLTEKGGKFGVNVGYTRGGSHRKTTERW